MSIEINWYDGIPIALDPDASLRYKMDLSDYLAQSLTPDTLSTALVDGGGLTISDISNDTTSVTFRIAGSSATPGDYTVRVRFTTAGGDTDDRSIIFTVAER